MLQPIQRAFSMGLALLLACHCMRSRMRSRPMPNQGTGYVLRAESDLVLTNVVVRDAKTGQVVLGLKQSDFTVLENGKPQQISDFDFESVDMAKPLNEATISGLASSAQGQDGDQRRAAGGFAGSPADRVVLRSDFDAAGGSGPQRGCGEGVSEATRCSRRI